MHYEPSSGRSLLVFSHAKYLAESALSYILTRITSINVGCIELHVHDTAVAPIQRSEIQKRKDETARQSSNTPEQVDPSENY